MTTFIMVIIICVGMIIVDVIPLYKNQQWLSFFVYLGLLTVAIVVAITMDVCFQMPCPADWFKKIIILIWGLED